MKRTSARARLWVFALLGALLVLGALKPASAVAGVMTQKVCLDDAGNPTSADGWTEWDGGPWRGGTSLGSVQTCGDGVGPLGLSLGHDYPTNVNHALRWTYTAPANTRISAFNVREWYYIDWPIGGYGNPNYGNPYAFRSWHDEWALNNFFETPLPPYGGATNSGWHNLARSGVDYGSLSFFITCADDGNPTGGDCMSPSGTEWQLSAGSVDLRDETAPQIGGVSGSLSTAGEKRGSASISFNASDTGVGVYRAIYTVDGTVVRRDVLDSNGGHCAALTSGYVFAWSVPCKLSLSASSSFDTTMLKDGSHDVLVTVEDASGNSAIVWSGTIATHNAPAVATAPSISGSAVVGATLTGTAGSFDAPAGAGAVSSVQAAWLRCSDGAAIHCSAIAGQTGAAYTPTSADIGYYLVYQNTASDKDGTTVADSVPTLAVTAPANETGGPGAGGQTNSGSGTGGSGGPGGAGGSAQGLTLNLVSGSTLGSTSPWQISLRVSPRRVHRGTTIKLSGSVLTSPRPPQGKLVYLKARTVKVVTSRRGHRRRRMRRYGKWIAFMQLRTRSSGSFSATYRFRFGGRHLYQFEVIAPQEGNYLNATGVSSVQSVTET